MPCSSSVHTSISSRLLLYFHSAVQYCTVREYYPTLISTGVAVSHFDIHTSSSYGVSTVIISKYGVLFSASMFMVLTYYCYYYLAGLASHEKMSAMSTMSGMGPAPGLAVLALLPSLKTPVSRRENQELLVQYCFTPLSSPACCWIRGYYYPIITIG